MWALWLTLCYGLLCSAEKSFTLSTFRAEADPETASLLRRQNGNLPTTRDGELYWFGNVSVGDSKDLKLLIDTGSNDLIINAGKYKPSTHKKPYGTGKFSITYEGVNRAGFGFETINGTTQLDTVTAAGLTVAHQAVGNVTSFSFADIKHPPHPTKAYQGDGIIGFLGPYASSFHPQSNSWFFNLCKTKAISKCVLGLAFGTSGKGQLVVGKTATDLIDGELTVAPQIVNYGGFVAFGDVTLDNKIVAKNQTIVMDVGTNNIQGSIEVVKSIFKQLDIKPMTRTTNSVSVLTGYFPCDKPPTLGFSFPAQWQLKPGQKARIFNVSPKVWDAYNHGHNNCTSILGGTNILGAKLDGSQAFLLGQPFWAGHYINVDVTANTIGYGVLKDPSMASSA